MTSGKWIRRWTEILQVYVGIAADARVKNRNVSAENWSRARIGLKKLNQRDVKGNAGLKPGKEILLNTRRNDIKTSQILRHPFFGKLRDGDEQNSVQARARTTTENEKDNISVFSLSSGEGLVLSVYLKQSIHIHTQFSLFWVTPKWVVAKIVLILQTKTVFMCSSLFHKGGYYGGPTGWVLHS